MSSRLTSPFSTKISNSKLTLEEIQMYQDGPDRKMFTRLIMDMMRDPAESLLIIATWLWLEERGFSNIIGKTVGVSDILVSMLADEAVIFLKSLNVHTPRIDLKGGIHFTTHLTDQKLSLQTFESSKRFTAIAGIRNTLQTVCSRIFTDILLCLFFGTPDIVLDRPLLVPGFPHPLFGSLTISTEPKEYKPSTKIWEFASVINQGWTPSDIRSLELYVPADERTLFLTFSRGFPVSEDEVLDVFDKEYGDCVERIEMGNVSTVYEQPLYARLILKSFNDGEIILKGRRVSKFRVNGKHIWARRYEIRD
ncbi:hypothetical protein TIFTF001_014338 [Ficus carica]|uniref:Uncharacterized protein n=1 Tax=Ficus carica TaxID=3494 RepID=A0AA88A3K8_FICCA|nr:hypothetical protein TIFTF001_014338 [Ficus carica]